MIVGIIATFSVVALVAGLSLHHEFGWKARACHSAIGNAFRHGSRLIRTNCSIDTFASRTGTFLIVVGVIGFLAAFAFAALVVRRELLRTSRR